MIFFFIKALRANLNRYFFGDQFNANILIRLIDSISTAIILEVYDMTTVIPVTDRELGVIRKILLNHQKLIPV